MKARRVRAVSQRPVIRLVPVFLAMFVVVRRSPVLLYRSDLRKGERLPFALYSATERPMVVAISEIGLRLNIMRTEIAHV